MSENGTDRPRLLADNFEKCNQCGEIVLIHGRGECLELDDTVFCPRHARGRIDDADWECRWGTAMDLLETIRNDSTKAIKYHLAQGVGDWWVVHREDQIYEQWSRCDDDERNCTTISESSVIENIERRSLVGSYVGFAPHVVDIADAPINATVESKQRAITDGGIDVDDTDRGKDVNLGPFQFRTPDRPCRVVDCEEKADGVVYMKNASVDACIYCAPQFLQNEDDEWTPLAGGRSLPTGTKQESGFVREEDSA